MCFTYVFCVYCCNISALSISFQRKAPGVSLIVWFVIWCVWLQCRLPYHWKKKKIPPFPLQVLMSRSSHLTAVQTLTAAAYLKERSLLLSLAHWKRCHIGPPCICSQKKTVTDGIILNHDSIIWLILWDFSEQAVVGLNTCCALRKVKSLRVKSWN